MVGREARTFGLRAQAALGAWLLLACPGPPGGAPKVALAEPAPVVRFMGRFDRKDPERPRFAWPGSTVATRFTGAALRVKLHGTGFDQFEVTVDGAPTRVFGLTPGKDDYEVVSGLDGGAHEVALSKRTEARIGEVQFLGFSPDAALSAPARPPRRRVELIGDSITAGYGIEGVGPACRGNAVSLEDEFQAYGAVTARALGADHVTLAWAGGTTEQVSELYDRTIPSEPDSRWDFTAWTPDVVVINLGTNDFTRGDPGQTTFSRPYMGLVQKVRGHYPGATIVCALGPMLSDTYPQGAHALTRARSYLRRVVSDLVAAGDGKIIFLEFPAQDFANGLGCDYHPSLRTHQLMAERLTATLRGLMGW